jgi:hypothetical protein
MRIAQSRGRMRWTPEGILVVTAGMDAEGIVHAVEGLLEWLSAETRRSAPPGTPAPSRQTAEDGGPPDAAGPVPRVRRMPHRAATG